MPHLIAAPTLLDIYTRQVEMSTALAVIQERLKVIPDQEQRLRRLEDARSRIIGAAVSVSVIVSALGAWIGAIFSHH